MKHRIWFESHVRCFVIAEPTWFERLVLQRRPYDRAAERAGWAEQWFWVDSQGSVPDDVEQDIEAAWDNTLPAIRAALTSPTQTLTFAPAADDPHAN